jgi:hypothetical protein
MNAEMSGHVVSFERRALQAAERKKYGDPIHRSGNLAE